MIRLKACLNGNRRRADQAGIPETPSELATAAANAVAAGADAVHVHPRDSTGSESLHPADIGAAVAAIRAACPGTPIGVSTGLWITDGDVALRGHFVRRWHDLGDGRPDFASVNVSEPGFTDLADILHADHIGLEAGVWSVADADVVAASGIGGIERILVEIIGAPAAEAIGLADAILGRLDALGIDAPRLLHGEEATCWPLVRHAAQLGLSTRVGLEDILVDPTGIPVVDNAALVRLALGLIAH